MDSPTRGHRTDATCLAVIIWCVLLRFTTAGSTRESWRSQNVELRHDLVHRSNSVLEHQVTRALYVIFSLSAVVLLTAVNVARMSAEPPGEVCWLKRQTSLMPVADFVPPPDG